MARMLGEAVTLEHARRTIHIRSWPSFAIGARRLGARPRRLAGDPARPVHRGHARRGTFTVDDPRFSTAQVVGPSMLSLDGDEHRRHRDPFAEAFRLVVGPRPVHQTSVDAIAARARRGTGAARRRRDPPRPRRAARRACGRGARWSSPTSRRRRSSAGTTRSSPPSIAYPSAARSGRGTPGCRRSAGAARAGHDRRGRRHPRRRDRHAHAAGGRVECSGHDVRRHRDQRRHDDLAVLARPAPTRPQLGRRPGRPDARHQRRRGVAAPRAGRRAGRPLRHHRRRARRGSDPARRPRHRVPDGGQPRPGDVSRTRTGSTSTSGGARPTSTFARAHTPASACTWPGWRRGAALAAALDGWPDLRPRAGCRPHRPGSSSASLRPCPCLAGPIGASDAAPGLRGRRSRQAPTGAASSAQRIPTSPRRGPQPEAPVTDARTIVFFPERRLRADQQLRRASATCCASVATGSCSSSRSRSPGTLEAKGFEERLMRLGPPPAEPEVPGQFWIDFIRDTAPVFRKPTIEQLGEFIAPDLAGPHRRRQVRRPAPDRDLRRGRAGRHRRGQRRRLPGHQPRAAGRGSGSCRATRWR